MGTSSSKPTSKSKKPSKSTSSSVMEAFAGKPKTEPRTNKKVTLQKIETASKTGVISLTRHQLSEIPREVWAIEKMTTLDLTNNALEALPGSDGVARLSGLKTLKLDGNRLAALPAELMVLAKLVNFSCEDNALPPGALRPLAALPKLAKVLAGRNRLGASVFDDLVGGGGLAGQSLTVLHLDGNGIGAVPASVGELAHLAELSLDDNALESVPGELGGCKRLKVLSLRRNRITGDVVRSGGEITFQPLPAALFTDTKLERLNLEGNPILRRQLTEFNGVDAWLDRCSKTKQKDLALYMS